MCVSPPLTRTHTSAAMLFNLVGQCEDRANHCSGKCVVPFDALGKKKVNEMQTLTSSRTTDILAIAAVSLALSLSVSTAEKGHLSLAHRAFHRGSFAILRCVEATKRAMRLFIENSASLHNYTTTVLSLLSLLTLSLSLTFMYLSCGQCRQRWWQFLLFPSLSLFKEYHDIVTAERRNNNTNKQEAGQHNLFFSHL